MSAISNTDLITAITAGLVLFLSPCVLPLNLTRAFYRREKE